MADENGQLDTLEREGFVHVPGALTAAQTERVRERIDHALGDVDPENG